MANPAAIRVMFPSVLSLNASRHMPRLQQRDHPPARSTPPSPRNTGVKSVLQQCYGDPAAVDDELVDIILTPGLQPGAVDVFLDFISYSSGPLPEQQLEVGAEINKEQYRLLIRV